MLLSPVLVHASFRHLRAHPGQLVLCLLGIALGVAVPVATSISLESARRSLALSKESLVTSSHRLVVGSMGIPETIYAELRSRKEGRAAVPVVEGLIRVQPQGDRPTVATLLGVDPYRLRGDGSRAGFWDPSFTQVMQTPGGVALEAEAAALWGVEVGDTIPLQPLRPGALETLRVVALFEAAESTQRGRLRQTFIADIGTAQRTLNQLGRLSRIEVELDDAEVTSLSGWIRQEFPQVTLEPNGAVVSQLQELTRSFELNLQCLSLLALVVGMFLILNAMTFSVVQRQRFFGRLRALGVTRFEVVVVVLGEGLLLGFLGTCVGLIFGWALGLGLVHIVALTINDLYYRLELTDVQVSWGPLLEGIALGLLMPVLAALKPALDASRSRIQEVLRRSEQEQRGRRQTSVWALLALTFGASAVAILRLWPGSLTMSYVALFLILVGFAALTPWVTRYTSWLLGRVPGGCFGAMRFEVLVSN